MAVLQVAAMNRRTDDGAANASETSVNVYQTAWRNNREDSHLHALLFLKRNVTQNSRL
jgi:hypothetical protein